MFDWFWNFLYSITKGLLELVDMVMDVALLLVGIDPIPAGTDNQDLLTFILGSKTVLNAIVYSSLLGIILLFILSVFAIIRCILKEKSEDTPVGVVKKAFYNLLLILLVPTIMFAFTLLINAFLAAMYKGLIGASSPSIGSFLFASFAESSRIGGGVDLATINWHSTSEVRSYVNLNDFSYIYSWIVGICVLLALGTSCLTLVERLISIALLFIAAPFTVASAVIDDGARFKSWRDQILVKFLTGYGMLVGIVLYCMISSVIVSSGVVFFKNGTLNAFAKCMFLLGGGVSLRGVQAVVGNLVQAGAGDRAMMDQDVAARSMGGILKTAGGAAWGLAKSPVTLPRFINNAAKEIGHKGFGTALGNALGFKSHVDYADYDRKKSEYNSGNKNNNSPQQGNDQTSLNAINGGQPEANNNNNNNNNNNSGNQNTNSPRRTQGENMVNNAINGALNNDDMR